MGKAGFRRLISLELVPEPAEILFLIRGKQTEKVIRRLLFPLLHSLLRLIVVSVGVARLNLDHVVDQKHRHDLQDIDLFGSIFVEKHRHQRDMPGVLRIVLPAAPVGEISLPEDLLLLVHRKNKINLPLHALVHVFSFSCRPETLCPGRHLLPAGFFRPVFLLPAILTLLRHFPHRPGRPLPPQFSPAGSRSVCGSRRDTARGCRPYCRCRPQLRGNTPSHCRSAPRLQGRIMPADALRKCASPV